MADEAEEKSNVPLPPKLDLRKIGIMKDSPAVATAAAPVPPRPTTPPAPPPAVRATSAPVSSGDESATTMRITLPEELPMVKIGGVPQARPLTSVEIRPAAQPAPSVSMRPAVGSPPPASATRLVSKSETSRIPLGMATAAAGATPGKSASDLKTIRIRPFAPATAVKVAAPSAPAAADTSFDDKRKTSRISLDAALAMEDKGGDKGVPKTIRLKKPGETTAKASPTLDTIRVASAPGRTAMSQTSRLEDQVGGDEEGPSPTRRKTIKVKRTSDKPGGFRVTTGAGEPSGTVEGETGASEEVESGSGVFDGIAVAAAALTIIMTFVVMFMLASQAWGPNPCLTQLSSWTTGPDFGWTGKTRPPVQ